MQLVIVDAIITAILIKSFDVSKWKIKIDSEKSKQLYILKEGRFVEFSYSK